MASLLTRLRTAASAVRQMSTSTASYTERMEKTGRPLSPHLTIYRLPLIAWSSVTVRMTGMALSAGVAGIAGVTLLKGGDTVTETASAIGSSAVGPVAKFTVAFPIVYHVFGAVRHAVWDTTAKGFSNQMMLQSSYAIFGATTVASLALAAYSLPPKEKKPAANAAYWAIATFQSPR